jgi:hypothetical protein
MRHVPPGKLAGALGIPAAAPSMSQAFSALPGLRLVGAVDVSAPSVVRWKRIELALGLELHVRDDASVDVQELALRMRAMCAEAVGQSSRSSG